MQLALLDPLPHLLNPFRKVLRENRVREDLGQLRKDRLVVRDELEEEIRRIRTLVKREQPVDRTLPEYAHRPEHDVVKVDEPPVVDDVAIRAAVQQRVRVQKCRRVVNEPERSGGRAHREVVDRLPQDCRTLLLVGAVLKEKLKV